MRDFTKDVACFSIITLVILMSLYRLFWPLHQFVVTPDFGRNDSFHLSIATKYFLWQKIQANELPLWAKDIGSGYPMHAEGQIGTFFLPNLILYKVFDFVPAYNVSLFLSVWLFAVGMYMWLRVANHSHMTSLYASLTASFSGIIFTHLTHITLLQSLSLLPCIMAFVLLLMQKPSLRNALILGTLLSQQLLAGFVQASFITLLLMGGFILFHLFRNRSQLILKLSLLCISLVIFIGQSMILFLPAREFLSQISDPDGFSFSTATQFDFPSKHLMTFLDPFYFGNPKFGTYPPFQDFEGSIFWENTGFIGLLPIGLFIVGLIKGKSIRKRSTVFVFWIIIMIASFLCMLGDASPFYFIFTYWPFNLFRVPSRFIWTFVLGIIWLSAISFESFWRHSRPEFLKRLLLVAFVCINTATMYGIWSNYNALMPAELWLQRPPSVEDIAPESRVMNVGTEVAQNEVFLHTGWQDMSLYVFWRNFIYPNSNMFWNISHAQESMGRVLRRTSVIRGYESNALLLGGTSATASAAFDHILTLNGVTHVLTPYATFDSSILKETDTMVEKSKTVSVYKNMDMPSRVYFAQRIQKILTLSDFEKSIHDTTIDFKSIAFTESDLPALPASSDAKAKIVAETDTSIRIETKENKDTGLLVLRDTWYPGWKAEIDGKETAIYPVNIHHRSVLVPPGDHTVTFVYKPTSFFQGMKISIIFWLGTVSMYFVGLLFEKRLLRFFTYQK